MAQLAQRSPDIAGQLTSARQIVAFRNRLIHGYASIVNRIVWDVVTTDLPALEREISALLADESA